MYEGQYLFFMGVIFFITHIQIKKILWGKLPPHPIMWIRQWFWVTVACCTHFSKNTEKMHPTMAQMNPQPAVGMSMQQM